MDGVSISRDTQISVAASAMFPGFRFSPTDEELISYYLRKKLEGSDRCVEVIADIDFCKFEPWDMPAKSVIHSDSEWFFFSARGRKYPNGSQSRRATELGYWKATGKERNVKSGTNVIGTKRTLVFHVGRAPKGERTEWIMHEYCMTGQSQDSMVVCRLRRNTDFRPNENGSRVSQGRRNLSNNDNGNDYGAQDGGMDREGSSGKGKAVESSSSYNSHSVEQNDAVSGTEQKQSNSFVVAESSSRLKGSGDEEDCYADILKDDIINLDESALSGTLDLIYSEQTSHQSLQSATTTTVPSLGTSSESPHPLSQPSMATSYRKNRPAGDSSGSPGGKEAQKYTVTIDLSPKCLINGLRTGHYLISIVLLIFTLLLALCCCLCGYCYR